MKVRHRMEGFSFYDYDNIAIHLEKMAQKGWMLEKIWNGFWKYRKIRPQKLKFAVTYFWEASDENMQHTENQEIFLESCEQAGWRLCAEWMQMQIFCSEQENPIPIETDEAAKLDNIHLCMSQQYLKTNLFLLLIMSVLSFSSGVNLIKTPLSALTISSIFWGTVFTVAFLVYLLWSILGYWNWYRASKASVRSGGRCVTLTRWNHWVTKGLILLSFFAVVLAFVTIYPLSDRIYVMVRIGLFLFMVAICSWLRVWMKKRKVNQSFSTLVIVAVGVVCAAGILSWKLGWEKSVWKEKLDPQPVDIYLSKYGIEWDVYDDAIPLRVEDMKETEETVYSYKWTRKDESILAKCYAAAQRERGEANAPELYYQIVEVRLPVLYDLCLNGLQQDDWWVEDEEFFPVEDERWQADRVYRKYVVGGAEKTPLNEYLICWDRFLVRISLDWEPDSEDIKVIREKLSAPVLERKL